MATDLDSRNGTALNGEPLDRPRRLRDGDTLIVGGHRLEVSTRRRRRRSGRRSPASEPSVALTEEERATAAALVAPYRSEGAFAGRPATRAEIAEALHVSERTAQRRLDALAAKLDVPGDAGRDRPRQIAARVIELGLDRCARRADGPTAKRDGPSALTRTGPKVARWGARVSLAGTAPWRSIGGQRQPDRKEAMRYRHSLIALFVALSPSPCRRAAGAAPSLRGRRLLPRHPDRNEKSRRRNAETGEAPKTETKTIVEGGLFAVKDGHLNQLTEDPTDTEPAFSPDGRTIAFVRGGDLFSVRADGSGLRQLTSGAELDSAPVVSPDGRLVVFERRAAAGAPGRPLHGQRSAAAACTPLTSGADDDHEADFSADGKRDRLRPQRRRAGGGTTTTSTRCAPAAPAWPG